MNARARSIKNGWLSRNKHHPGAGAIMFEFRCKRTGKLRGRFKWWTSDPANMMHLIEMSNQEAAQ